MRKTSLLLLAATVFASSSTAATIVHYTFDGDSLDSSGLANHATAFGTTTYVPSDTSQAIFFDNPVGQVNATHWIQLPNSPSVLALGSASFTYSMRIRTTDRTDNGVQNGRLFGNLIPAAGVSRGVLLNYGDGDTAQTYYAISGQNLIQSEMASRLDPAAVVTDGEWHWIAVSFDRSTGTASHFVDDHLVSELTMPGPPGLIPFSDISLGRVTFEPWFSARQTAVDEFLLTDFPASVPEPSAFFLVASGLAGLVLRARKSGPSRADA